MSSGTSCFLEVVSELKQTKKLWLKKVPGARLKKAGAGGANSRQESAAVLHIKSAQSSYLNRDDAVDDLTRQVGSNQLQVAD